MHYPLMNDNSELQTWLGPHSEKHRSRLMVATICLGTSVDIVVVRIVGNSNSAFKATKWWQYARRSGRNGRKAYG